MKNKWNKIKDIVIALKGLTTIGITDVVAAGISAIFWFYMATVLGAEHYGEVSYFLAIGGIASTASLMGGANVLTVYVAKNVRLESSVYVITIVAGIIASIIVFILFSNIETSAYTLGAVIFGLISSEILGKKLYKSYSKYTIIQKILMVSLAIGFYYLLGPNGVILGIALAFFPYSIRIYKGFKESKIDFSLVKSRLGFMMNSYILTLSGTFNDSIAKLIIAPLLGFTLLGNYQLGLQFLSILMILPATVYKYTLPHDASGNPNERLKKAAIFITTGLVILVILLSPIVVPLIFPKFTKAIEVIQILSISIIPGSINYVYQSKFYGVERSRVVLFGSLIFFISQVIFIIFLGNIFGINGIAFAVVLAQTAECIFYFITNKSMKLEKND
jgi:O-antigen/teichoic acid export membrane protein